ASRRSARPYPGFLIMQGLAFLLLAGSWVTYQVSHGSSAGVASSPQDAGGALSDPISNALYAACVFVLMCAWGYLALGNRSGCENRNHAAACDFWALLGSRDGAASPRKAASCAAVRYSKTLRCCCFNVATTVIMFATKREPSSLCVPKLPV